MLPNLTKAPLFSEMEGDSLNVSLKVSNISENLQVKWCNLIQMTLLVPLSASQVSPSIVILVITRSFFKHFPFVYRDY